MRLLRARERKSIPLEWAASEMRTDGQAPPGHHSMPVEAYGLAVEVRRAFLLTPRRTPLTSVTESSRLPFWQSCGKLVGASRSGFGEFGGKNTPVHLLPVDYSVTTISKQATEFPIN